MNTEPTPLELAQLAASLRTEGRSNLDAVSDAYGLLKTASEYLSSEALISEEIAERRATAGDLFEAFKVGRSSFPRIKDDFLLADNLSFDSFLAQCVGLKRKDDRVKAFRDFIEWAVSVKPKETQTNYKVQLLLAGQFNEYTSIQEFINGKSAKMDLTMKSVGDYMTLFRKKGVSNPYEYASEMRQWIKSIKK